MNLEREHQTLIEALATSATVELLEAYRLPVTRESGARACDECILFCGIIGYNGPGIRGTCILAASEGALRASSELDTPARDWIAELTNQLMGRVKTKLIMHGVEVYLSTPVAIRGEHLAPLPRKSVEPIAFETASKGCIYVWVEIETAEHVRISPEPVRAALEVVEGEAILF